MTTVRLGDLKAGDAFLMPHRHEGRNIGELLSVGVGSCRVKVPRIPGVDEDEVSGWEDTRVTPELPVIPVERGLLNEQQVGRTERNKSRADSPVERVHAICDELFEEAKKNKEIKPKDRVGSIRVKVLERCTEAGININTAKTQYYAWRKKQR